MVEGFSYCGWIISCKAVYNSLFVPVEYWYGSNIEPCECVFKMRKLQI